MFRRSTNNPWISPSGYLNTGAFDQIGGFEQVGSRFPGLLGQTVVHSNASALRESDSAIGTLYMGIYQLVRFSSTASAVQRGELLFWETLANNGLNDFEVTNVVTAPAAFRAGFALFGGAGDTLDNKYGWIQVAGLASTRFIDDVTANTLGTVVVQTSLTSAEVDAIADATDYITTLTAYKTILGIAYELPADTTGGAITRVLMNPMGFYPNIG